MRSHRHLKDCEGHKCPWQGCACWCHRPRRPKRPEPIVASRSHNPKRPSSAPAMATCGCLLFPFLALIVAVAIVFVLGLMAGENSDGGGSSRESVLERQEADYKAMVDRYVVCKTRPLRLEQDFEAFRRSLDRYQTDPTEMNRNWYLLIRKNVELQLDEC